MIPHCAVVVAGAGAGGGSSTVAVGAGGGRGGGSGGKPRNRSRNQRRSLRPAPHNSKESKITLAHSRKEQSQMKSHES